MRCLRAWVVVFAPGLLPVCALADGPSRDEAVAAVGRAVEFFHTQVASHGGYVWRYSGDLTLREGEALADDGQSVWVQPPGTPTVGEAFLDAYSATGAPRHLAAARDAARCLLDGQLQSGGWYYHIDFDPAKRKKFAYRIDARKPSAQRDEPPGGWDVWRRRRFQGDMTVLDDDTTQSAVRFLMRLDRVLEFRDERLHAAALYALESIAGAQYPNGSWSHYHDRFPHRPPDAEHYPLLRASYPESWSRTWTKDWTGCYRLNDRITLDCALTLLEAAEVYGERKYAAAAERAGQFLILAQMPAPQPAWAQQYDRAMQPVWDRKFEPPAISGFESQDVLKTLLLLYRRTGDQTYLEPVPRALAYLRKSILPNGKLARFYELRTNRPLYFTRDYRLTYDGSAAPRHYGFEFDSRLDEIEAAYGRLRESGPNAPTPAEPLAELARQARSAIDALDERGAWVVAGHLDGHEVRPPSGVIESRTFADNVALLSRYVAGLQR